MASDDFSNAVVLEEPAIHRPSFGKFSIAFLQQIDIFPMVGCNFEWAQPQVIKFSMFTFISVLGIPC
jgi:hypothetical protein